MITDDPTLTHSSTITTAADNAPSSSSRKRKNDKRGTNQETYEYIQNFRLVNPNNCYSRCSSDSEYGNDEQAYQGEPGYNHLYCSPRHYEVMFLFLPMDYFTPTSKALGQMKLQTHPVMCEWRLKALQLFVWLWHQFDDAQLVYELVLKHESKAGQRIIKPDDQQPQPEPDPNYTPQFSGRRLRLSLPIFAPAVNGQRGQRLADALQDLLDTNAKCRLEDNAQRGITRLIQGDDSATGSSGGSGSNRDRGIIPWYKSVEYAEYQTMCQFLNIQETPQEMLLDTDVLMSHLQKDIANCIKLQDIGDGDCPWNPLNAFCLERSFMVQARFDNEVVPDQLYQEYIITDPPNSHEDQDNWKCYKQPFNGHYSWVFRNHHKKMLTTNNFSTMMLPEVKIIHRDKSMIQARNDFVRQAMDTHWKPFVDRIRTRLNAPLGLLANAQLSKRDYDEQHYVDMYETEMDLGVIRVEGFGISKLIEECTDMAVKAEESLPVGADQDQMRFHRRKLQLEMNKLLFQGIMTKDSIVCPAFKAKIQHLEEHMEKSPNLCLPTRNNYCNLSSFGNMLVNLLLSVEGVARVNTFHIAVFNKLCSVYYVDSEGKFQLHSITSGPPESGKTELLNFLRQLMVVGTYEDNSHTTAKARFTVSADPNDASGHLIHDGLVILMQEAPPEKFGIDGKNTSSGGYNSSNSKIALNETELSHLKTHLSEGQLNWSGQTQDDIGKYKHRIIMIRSPVMVAMNAPFYLMPDALRTRMYEVMEALRKRHDNGGVLELATSNSTPAQKAVWDICTERLKLTQARVGMVWKAILSGELKMSLDAFNVLALNICYQCEAMGLKKTTETRKLQKVKMAVESLVVWEAVHSLFDHPTSNLRCRPWHPDFLVYIEKYLYAKKEHITLAFGLFSRQYEDPLEKEVRKAVFSYLRKGHQTAVAEDIQRLVPAVLVSADIDLDQQVEGLVQPQPSYVSGSDGKFHLSNSRRNRPMIESLERQDSALAYAKYWIIADRCFETLKEEWMRVLHFSKLIWKSMTDQPTVRQIQEVVRQMLSEEFQAGQQRVPLLHFNTSHNTISIPVEYGEVLETDQAGGTVKRAIEAVLQHKHAKRGDYLYGEEYSKDGSHETPYLMQVISVRDGSDYDPLIKIPNRDYLDKELQRATDAMTADAHVYCEDGARGTSAEGASASAEGVEDPSNPCFSYSQMFDSQDIHLHDDVDDYARMKHNARIYLSPVEDRMAPSNDDFQQRSDNVQFNRNIIGSVYPLCLNRAHPLERNQVRQRTNSVTSYSSKDHISQFTRSCWDNYAAKNVSKRQRSNTSDASSATKSKEQQLAETRLRLKKLNEQWPLRPLETCGSSLETLESNNEAMMTWLVPPEVDIGIRYIPDVLADPDNPRGLPDDLKEQIDDINNTNDADIEDAMHNAHITNIDTDNSDYWTNLGA